MKLTAEARAKARMDRAEAFIEYWKARYAAALKAYRRAARATRAKVGPK